MRFLDDESRAYRFSVAFEIRSKGQAERGVYAASLRIVSD